MRSELIEHLRAISEEEQKILDGDTSIHQDLYTSGSDFVIDSDKLLETGRLIDIRTHTRFTDFPEHGHNYVEITYVVSGAVTTTVNREDTLYMREGDLLMLGPGARHSIRRCGLNDIAVNFIILPEFFSRPLAMVEQENILRDFIVSVAAGNSSRDRYLLFHTRGIVPVENLIENLIWTLIIRRHGMNSINQTTLGLVFMNLSLLCSDVRLSQGGEKQRCILEVLRYIEDNYQSATLNSCAEKTGYSAYYLSRLIKNYTNMNFTELLQQRRLQQAVYYLENTTLTADDILVRIGYDNSSYFYRLFRKKYGCSPRRYRLEHSHLASAAET